MHRIAAFGAALAFLFALLAGGVTPSAANPDFELGPAGQRQGAGHRDAERLYRQAAQPRLTDGREGARAVLLPLGRLVPYCQAQMMDLNTVAADVERARLQNGGHFL
jgi:hypothetical protein